MKILSLFIFLLTNYSMASTDLSLVTPVVNQMKVDHPVQIDIALNGSFLKISFEVTADEINSKPKFTPKDYPFQFDVVELFLSVGDDVYPYYEFEISPHDQTFVVRIDTAKKFINNAKVEWTHSAQLTAQGWTAEMTIDLAKLGWSGDIAKVKGNVYAITGKSPNRHFWSLSLPKMKKANFHSPQYFLPLIIDRK